MAGIGGRSLVTGISSQGTHSHTWSGATSGAVRRVGDNPSRGHDQIGSALDDLAARGVPPERIILGGFSQGECIALDLLPTAPRPLGAAVSLCGCLIGADDVRFPSSGSLAGVRALLTGAEADSWVDPEDVRVAAEALRAAGAEVDLLRGPVSTAFATKRSKRSALSSSP